jgi:hypothetical protein
VSTGHNRIEIARQQQGKPTRLTDAPGYLTRLLTGAKIEISSGRPHNG